MSRRVLPWVCTLGLIGVVALTLPSSVLADPGTDAVPAELTPGGSRSAGWEDTKPPDRTPRPTHSPDTRHRDSKPPYDRPTPGTTDSGTTDTGTADTWIPDTGEGELGRVTEGVDGGDPDGPDGMPDGTGGGADEPSDTGPAGSPSPAPAERSPVALLQKLQTLYHQSEDSAKAYRQTENDLRAVRQQSDTLTAQLARARAQLEGGRADAGRLARLQYQASGSPVSSYLRVLLARNPQQAMDTRHLIREAARDQRAAVARFTSGERKADALAAKAHAALDKQQALTDRARYQRETAAGKLKEVEALLATLSPEQLAELGRLEAQATDGMRRDDRPAEA
ncbi:coiled-coil domain-containing protein [Streptomyces sp. NPDC101227]|uniref:coiled-coil domain-containing protein n=1 Tax=Streptomyces sp. NPDC101227 TaxID=3366136 RepID=UPI00381D3531